MHFSMASPSIIRRSSFSINRGENDEEEIISLERGTNIEGPISSAYVRLNFCFKLKMDHHLGEQSWPDGNYSIFGTEDGCHKGENHKPITTCTVLVLIKLT